MSAPSTKPKTGPLSLSERELTQLAIGIGQCLADPSGLKINNAKFAELNGLKNANTASAVWGGIKKKLFAGLPAATKTAAACTPAKSAGDDNAAAIANEEEDSTTTTKLATKKRTRAPRAKKDPDAESTTPRKRAKKTASPQLPPTPSSDAGIIKNEEVEEVISDEIAAMIGASAEDQDELA